MSSGFPSKNSQNIKAPFVFLGVAFLVLAPAVWFFISNLNSSSESPMEDILSRSKQSTGRSSEEQEFSGPLPLKASKENILTSEKVRLVETGEDGERVDKGEVVKYTYVSKIEVPSAEKDGLKEDVSRRASNAQFFPKSKSGEGGKETIAKFFPTPQFAKSEADGKWYQIETATATEEEFEKGTELSFLEKAKSLFALKALATSTSPWSGAGDGDTYGQDASSWDTAHNATNGGGADYTDSSYIETSSRWALTGNRTIYRAFLPFDTSGIPDDATIDSATLSVYVSAKQTQDDDGDDYINVVQTSQASTSELVTEDYDQCGSTHSPTVGSTGKDITGDITTSAYNTWTLDSTGRGWVSKTGYSKLGLREGHDILDSVLAQSNRYNYVRFSSSEYTGTSQDPYMTIEYTESGPATTDKVFKGDVRMGREVILNE